VRSHRSITQQTARLVALAVAVLHGACAGGPDIEASPKRPKVLVIGIDGVRPDVLAEVATPNLEALMDAGTFSDRAQTGRPTVSGPGWSSFLTGVWPDKHGVTDNSFHGKRYDEFPDFLTRIERARPELVTFAAIDWLPLGADSAGGPVIGAEPDVKYVVDGDVLTWPGADSAVVAASVEQLRTGDPDALFVYLGNPDVASHESGGIGKEYRESIVLADRHVGALLDAMRGRPTWAQEDWLVVVSTDHGRREDGGHGGDSPEESTIFFIVSGPSAMLGSPPEPPRIVDVPVTALVHLGIAIDPAWQLDGKPVGLAR
jgi:predicted AlkP superfamily pyrophosphatase or phosphodiesterase